MDLISKAIKDYADGLDSSAYTEAIEDGLLSPFEAFIYLHSIIESFTAVIEAVKALVIEPLSSAEFAEDTYHYGKKLSLVARISPDYKQSSEWVEAKSRVKAIESHLKGVVPEVVTYYPKVSNIKLGSPSISVGKN